MIIDSDLAAALADTDQPRRYLDALTECYRAAVGFDLLTLLVFDRARRLAHRVHTTDPHHYPTSDAKPVSDTDWVDRVLDRGEVFVANHHQEFRPHYVDWEKLRDLGMDSAINYPVVVGGAVLGTVNLIAGADFYTPARVAAGRALAPLAAIAFLLLDRAAAVAGSGGGAAA